MKRAMNILAVAVTGLFLTTQIAWAQHSEHHKGEKADTTQAAQSGQLMPMQQMMQGNSMTPRGMMRSTGEQSPGMMQGKGMMKEKGMMHGKGMMKGGMHGMGMMAGGMMNMSDPVFQALHNSGCPGFLLMSADELQLTDGQKKSLKSLKSDFHKTAIRNKADIDVAKIDLKEQASGNNPDFENIRSDAAQIGAMEQQLRDSFISTVAQARKVLTEEQLQQLAVLPQHGCSTMMKK